MGRDLSGISSVLAAFALLAAGCTPLIELGGDPGCEPLNPAYCHAPWPSDRYLAEDESTATGYRVAYVAGAAPINKDEIPFDFAPYNRFDGFSAASTLLAHFSRPPDLSDAAGHRTIDRSLDADSPTVLLDLSTGERVPHWVEIDARADAPPQTLLMIHPTERLEENTSYGVALRDLVDSNGQALGRPPAFDALVTGTPTDSEELEARRPSYEVLFETLGEAGIDKDGLLLAWWFHTASDASVQADLLHMRDDAMPRLTAQDVTCTVDDVQEPYRDGTQIFRRVHGTFSVPLYMNQDESQFSSKLPVHAVRGADGLPEFQGWGSVPWTVLIPNSLAQDPAGPRAGPLLQFGHGLLGLGEDEGSGSFMRMLTDELSMVSIATDWQGMSEHDDLAVTNALANLTEFYFVAERTMQGQVNQMALTRVFTTICQDLPELQVGGVSMIDPSEVYYLGISQGSILGATFMTLSPDISRGVLQVGGMPFPLVMDRSTEFYGADGDNGYSFLLEAWYPYRIDRLFLQHFIQPQWDLGETSGWIHRLLDGELAGIDKKVIYQVASGDALVANLASDIAGRTGGFDVIEGSAVTPWGMDTIPAPHDGSAFIYIDTGDPPVPDENLPPPTDSGSHEELRRTTTAIEQMRAFFAPDGPIIVPCDGVCDPD